MVEKVYNNNMEKNKCKRCGKETSNPVYCSRDCANKSNTKAWSKGLTKEDHPSLKKIGQNISKIRQENNWGAWNKGLTKENDDRMKKSAQNMSKSKKGNKKAIEAAKKNLKKATEARSKKCKEQRVIKEKQKEELKNISQEIEKLKRVEKFITQLNKVKDEKSAFNSMTTKEKVEYYLLKKGCKQTKNNLDKDRDWFFNKTKEILYKKTFFIKSEDINSRIYALFNNLKEHPKCKVCKNDLKWRGSFPTFCSNSCKNIGLSFEDNMKKLSKYVEPLFKIEQWEGVREIHKWRCKRCNLEFEDNWTGKKYPRCPNCYSLNKVNKMNKGVSLQELEMRNWIIDLGEEVESNYRVYKKKENNKKFHREIDIYLPDYKLGIELDGIYVHSEIGGGKDKNYHKEKDEFFQTFGIKVLHFWDIEWIEKTKIVKSIIKNKIGKSDKRVYARNCIVKELNSKQSRVFLNENHLQGFKASSIYIGLFVEDKIVSILSLSKSRYNKNYDFEITRFCSKLNTIVVGGFSKLLNYFLIRNKGCSIVSYVDLRFGKGNFYLKNNFKYGKTSSPNYFYTKDYINLESRIKYQKHKLKNILEIYDDSLSEWENMQLNGYDRIWDCGNSSYYLL